MADFTTGSVLVPGGSLSVGRCRGSGPDLGFL